MQQIGGSDLRTSLFKEEKGHVAGTERAEGKRVGDEVREGQGDSMPQDIS